ncbi:MAG: hypothetical protein IJT30_08800 [Muribaculaceae bacterium]|nr:hypothetical protein [Muribaculaceae bacterium]
MFTEAEHFFSLSCMAYVLTGVFVAAVRWFHTCLPYGSETGYYHPARRLITATFLSAVVVLPYVLRPSDAGAWTFAKSFFLFADLYYCAVLLFTYFGSIKHWTPWRRVAWTLAAVFGVPLAGLCVATLAGVPLSTAQCATIMRCAVAGGVAATAFCLWAIGKISLWIKEIIEDNYSNPDDFPVRYARWIVLAPLLHIVPIWAVVLLDSQAMMATMQWMLVVFNVVFLISILHTQRSGATAHADCRTGEQPAAGGACAPAQPSGIEGFHQAGDPAASSTATVDNDNDAGQGISQERVAELKRELVALVEGQQLFLKPHLTMAEVAGLCTYGRTYVSHVFKSELGGFFNYVNHLRLRHASDYQAQHPMATRDEIATASGFTSRQAYYNARRRLTRE